MKEQRSNKITGFGPNEGWETKQVQNKRNARQKNRLGTKGEGTRKGICERVRAAAVLTHKKERESKDRGSNVENLGPQKEETASMKGNRGGKEIKIEQRNRKKRQSQ